MVEERVPCPEGSIENVIEERSRIKKESREQDEEKGEARGTFRREKVKYL